MISRGPGIFPADRQARRGDDRDDDSHCVPRRGHFRRAYPARRADFRFSGSGRLVSRRRNKLVTLLLTLCAPFGKIVRIFNSLLFRDHVIFTRISFCCSSRFFTSPSVKDISLTVALKCTRRNLVLKNKNSPALCLSVYWPVHFFILILMIVMIVDNYDSSFFLSPLSNFNQISALCNPRGRRSARALVSAGTIAEEMSLHRAAARSTHSPVAASCHGAFFSYFHVVVPSRTEFYSSVSHAVGGRATSPRSPTPLFHAMSGCGGGGGGALAGSWLATSNSDVSRHQETQQGQDSGAAGSSTPGGVVCSNCDRLIV